MTVNNWLHDMAAHYLTLYDGAQAAYKAAAGEAVAGILAAADRGIISPLEGAQAILTTAEHLQEVRA